MTRAEKRERASKFRIQLKLGFALFLNEKIEETGSIIKGGTALDLRIHALMRENPDQAATIRQAYIEFVRELDTEVKKTFGLSGC